MRTNFTKILLVLHFWTSKEMKKQKNKKTWKLNLSLNLFRISVPIGRSTLKEWILTESQTNFALQTTWKKKLRKTVKRWIETVPGRLAEYLLMMMMMMQYHIFSKHVNHFLRFS
jgi:hypothetical protein